MHAHLPRLAASLGLFAALLFASGDVALASTTSSLLPVSDGNYTQWTPSTSTIHYTNVDESVCNGNTDYNSTTVAGNRDSYGVNVASVPNGATITQIGIVPCASRVSSGGTAPVMNVFYRANGVDSADSGSYSLSGTTPGNLATTTYGSLSVVKSATSTLEIGAVLTSGTKGAKLSRIATIVTYTPLNAPTSLSGTATSTSAVGLTWTDNSTNEDGFSLYRSTDGISYMALASTSANVTSYYDPGLSAGTKYYYEVQAFNSGGTTGFATTSVTTLSSQPAAPSGLTASSSQTLPQAALSWTDNSSNETNFEVLRSLDGISYSHLGTTTANTTAYTDVSLASSTTYYYEVRAYNSGGYSSVSNAASTTTGTFPAVATNVLANASTTALSIFVSWTDNASNELSYSLAESTSTASTTFKVVATLAPNTTSATYVPSFANTVYYFEVAANNGYGNSTSTMASSTSASVPAAPSGLSAVNSATSTALVNWSDNSSNELGFFIERAMGTSTFSQIATTTPNTTSYSDTGLLSGLYTYRVRAFNGVGDSAYSNQASTTIP